MPVRTAIPFRFRAEPVAIRESRSLGHAAKTLFTAIIDDAKRRGWRSRLSNAAFAQRIGWSVPTVKRALAELEAEGLIRRDVAAAGRIRLAIVVTWEGVDHPRSTEQAISGSPAIQGRITMSQGVDHPRSTSQSTPQTRDQTGPDPSLSEEKAQDPENRILTPAEVAEGLRAIMAGRWSPAMFEGRTLPADPSPEPPRFVTSVKTGAQAPEPAPEVRRVATSSNSGAEPPAPSPGPSTPARLHATQSAEPRRSSPPSGPSRTPEVDARRTVERMAVGCFKDARRAAWGPLPGRRRMTPAELQRQLAEVRRKYGGKAHAGPCPAPAG